MSGPSIDKLDVVAPYSDDGPLLRESRDTIRELRAKLEPAQFVLSEREAELLAIKGHCSNAECRLHYAHRGPCDAGATP